MTENKKECGCFDTTIDNDYWVYPQIEISSYSYGWICPVCGTVNSPAKLTCCKVPDTKWTADTKDIQE